MEQWKPIIWYEWLYEVSNFGRVKSLSFWKEKILKILFQEWWYSRVSLSSIYKKEKRFLVSRLVAIHFIPNPLNLPLVLHIKEDLDQNWFLYNWEKNLWWGTNTDNVNDREKKWRWIFSNNHPSKGKLWKDHPNSKKVNQYTKDGVFVKQWDSIMDVERWLWIKNSIISQCCKQKYWFKSAGGFRWEYVPNPNK